MKLVKVVLLLIVVLLAASYFGGQVREAGGTVADLRSR